MESVAAHAGVVQLGRDREAPRDVGIGRVERGVEARDLGQLGPPLEQERDRGEVVGLVQRRERDELLQQGDHVAVDPHRLGVIRPAVDHAVSDGLEVHPLRLPANEVRDVRHGALVAELTPSPQDFSDSTSPRARARDEARRRVDALDLASDDEVETGALFGEELELHARRAGVQRRERLVPSSDRLAEHLPPRVRDRAPRRRTTRDAPRSNRPGS